MFQKYQLEIMRSPVVFSEKKFDLSLLFPADKEHLYSMVTER